MPVTHPYPSNNSEIRHLQGKKAVQLILKTKPVVSGGVGGGWGGKRAGDGGLSLGAEDGHPQTAACPHFVSLGPLLLSETLLLCALENSWSAAELPGCSLQV